MMEKDAVVQELAMLENQLASSETLISTLTTELEKQKSKVSSIVQECGPFILLHSFRFVIISSSWDRLAP